jgi:hypothetical protein
MASASDASTRSSRESSVARTRAGACPGEPGRPCGSAGSRPGRTTLARNAMPGRVPQRLRQEERMADAPGAADRGMPVTSHCLAAFAGRAMMSFAQNGDARVLATESRECLSRQRSRINSCIRGLTFTPTSLPAPWSTGSRSGSRRPRLTWAETRPDRFYAPDARTQSG